jgi:superfamily II DNA/RNA helicase
MRFADPSTFPSLFHAPAEAGSATTAAPADAGGVATIAPADAVAPVAPAVTTTPPAAAPAAAATPAAAAAGPAADFGQLGVARPLVRALVREGVVTPFPIQQAAIPDALAGRDILGKGQTGSGKTLAFGLPMLTRLAAGARSAPGRPRGLVLVPTRELAMQVADALRPLGREVGLWLATAIGGAPYERQLAALERGVDVLVATPGRLKDLIERGACALDAVEVVVLDEADQMADMGFLPDVTELMALTPSGGQRLLFSATLDSDVDALVRRFLVDPATHAVGVETVGTMSHHLLLIPPHDKFAVAASIAARAGRTMMFAKTQIGVDELVGKLRAVGVRAGALHGGKSQAVRTRTLAEFREGELDVLVATDVAARGIHVEGVSLVVHVDPPRDSKDYLHRAGRTARAGASGGVVTLVLPRQRRKAVALVDRAGVEPSELRVRVGDPALAEVTGAREPSGVPVVDRPARSHGDRRRPTHQAGRRPSHGDGRRPAYGDASRPAGRPYRRAAGAQPDQRRH